MNGCFYIIYASEKKDVQTKKKKVEKSLKKVLTESVKACIIHQVAASKAHTKSLEQSGMILENDTESRRTRRL